MNALLVLSNTGELHSYIDLPERLGCPASVRNEQNPSGIDRNRSEESVSVRYKFLHCLTWLMFGVANDG